MAEIHLATARGPIRLPIAALTACRDEPGPATVLDAVRAAGLPLGQSCRGAGVCRSCAVDIVSGASHLGPETPLELRFGFTGERRLACQAQLPDPATDHVVCVAHRAWGRPPAADPAAPGSGTSATLEP